MKGSTASVPAVVVMGIGAIVVVEVRTVTGADFALIVEAPRDAGEVMVKRPATMEKVESVVRRVRGVMAIRIFFSGAQSDVERTGMATETGL